MQEGTQARQGVAQLARVLASEARSRRFESCYPDYANNKVVTTTVDAGTSATARSLLGSDHLPGVRTSPV